MSLILLIDLDDTLITNQMDTFIPVYLEALGNRLSKYSDPEILITNLLVATERMMRNTQPDFTLKEIFDKNYYPQIGIEYETLQPAIDDFYANHFPSLKNLTKPRLEGVAFVQEAFKRGYQIAIATNPLFPKSAVYQRLDWGNLSPDNYEYSIVTTYEDFHYAKPNPAYFAEILAQMGWFNKPVVMIGNDILNDIEPARGIGLPTYWVENGNSYAKFFSDDILPSGHGGLATIMDWIDSQSFENLQPKFDSPIAITAILYSTPAALNTITREMAEEVWNFHRKDDEWGPTEVMCHLRDIDQEIYLPRINSILSEDNPFIEAIDADQWAEERGYKKQNGHKALAEFINNRKKILDIISTFQQEEWDKEARHTIFGPTTMLELLQIYARHDRLHIQQIHQTLDDIKGIRLQ
jgi:FMN phosphatase YigB (HAD superfamily)